MNFQGIEICFIYNDQYILDSVEIMRYGHKNSTATNIIQYKHIDMSPPPPQTTRYDTETVSPPT